MSLKVASRRNSQWTIHESYFSKLISLFLHIVAINNHATLQIDVRIYYIIIDIMLLPLQYPEEKLKSNTEVSVSKSPYHTYILLLLLISSPSYKHSIAITQRY